MSSIVINGVTLSPAPIGNTFVDVYFKLASDLNYNLVQAHVMLDTSGNFVGGPITIPGLQGNVEYNIKLINECSQRIETYQGIGIITTTTTSTTTTSSTSTTTTSSSTSTTSTSSTTTTSTSTTTLAPNLFWVENTFACEKEGGFSVVKTISGLSSPLSTWYDTVSGFVYVADADDASGNVYWFNPNTATTAGDMIHSTTVMDNSVFIAKIDPIYRRMYFVGDLTGGMIVYDINSHLASQVLFGTNGSFRRTILKVTDNYIYCNDGTTSVVIIDRLSLSIISVNPIGSIPSGATYFSGDPVLHEINGEIWVTNNFSLQKKVAVYNPALTVLLTEIDFPSNTLWSISHYWGTAFYDETSGHLYIMDIGSNMRYVVDPVTRSVINSRLIINNEGKSNARLQWGLNPVTNELLVSYQGLNSNADGSPIKRTYIEDRSTYQYTTLKEGQYYTNLMPITGTNSLIGSEGGFLQISGVGPGYATDGSVTILSNSVSGANTGKKIILTLKEKDGNAGNIDTGNTKPNIPEDPNYIPPILNSPSCAATFTLTCPTDVATTFATGTLTYEFSILSSVKNNPAIAKIRVYAYNNTSAAIEGAATDFAIPFVSNWFSGSKTGLAGTDYTIQIQYLNSSNTVLATCTI